MPVDFSISTNSTILWAAEAARCFEVPLQVLHVVHDLGAAPGYYSRIKKQRKAIARLEETAQEILDELMDDLKKKYNEELAGLKLESRLVVGLPVSRILEVAEEIDAKMIVLGSRGRTGLPHLLLGSKALKVAQLSPRPVIILKETPIEDS